MGPCNVSYGAAMVRCRRVAGHEGEHGPGDHVEHAIWRALDATAHLRKLELEGEKIPPGLWNFLMRRETPDGE